MVRNRKDIYIVFIDLCKAFDGVSHVTILWSERSLGLPDHLTGYLEVYYRESYTTLFSNHIDILSGVSQGIRCPPSSLMQ